MAFLVLVINAQVDSEWTFLRNGQYRDFSPSWYLTVGVSLTLTMLAYVFTPHLGPIASMCWKFMRCVLRSGNRSNVVEEVVVMVMVVVVIVKPVVCVFGGVGWRRRRRRCGSRSRRRGRMCAARRAASHLRWLATVSCVRHDRQLYDRRCTMNRSHSRTVTQEQLLSLYSGTNMLLDDRYAQVASAGGVLQSAPRHHVTARIAVLCRF
jgi:hypothetical protein